MAFNPVILIILASRPSFGKTTLALNFARNICVENELEDNDVVLFISLEMSQEELVKRLLSANSGIPSIKKSIVLNYLSKKMLNYECQGTILEGMPILINQKYSISVDDLSIMIKDISKRHNIRAIIIDYLQLMEAPTSKSTFSREQQVAYISRKLKLLATQHKIPIIALSQLSRKPEIRENKKPIMSDLRESGSLEQDADIVMFLYRETIYQNRNSVSEDTRLLNTNSEPVLVDVAKNRHGKIGSFYLTFLKNICTFQYDGLQYDGSQVNKNNEK